jgi:hypothetical protein
VADLLTHTAETYDHTFEIWCVNPPFSPGPGFTPDEFTVVDWSIRYEGLDKFAPGVVPSQLDLQGLDEASPFLPLLSLAYDSSSYYYIKVYTKLGPSLIWSGVFINDLATREVVNGVRVTTLAAADGFGAMDQLSNGYVWNNTILPFTTQIAGQFDSIGLWKLFSGFAISQTITHSSAPSGRNILHYSGTTPYHYLYNQNTFEWRTVREWLDSILVAFGLQMYQKDGMLWFRSVWIDNPSTWDYYNRNGTHQSQGAALGFPTLTNVIADGILSFKPAAKYYKMTDLNSIIVDNYEAGGSGGLFQAANDYIFAATYLSDGQNHLDYDITKRIVFGLDPLYSGVIDFRLKYYVEFQTPFGSYWWNGSNAWITTETFKNYTHNNFHVDNPNASPAQIAYDFTENNVHLPVTPLPLGLGLIYHKLVFEQTGGSTIPDDPFGGAYQPNCVLQWSYTYDSTVGSNGLTYETDNSASVQGFNENLQTYHGDSYSNLLLSPGIRIFTNTGRTTYTESAGRWSTEKLPLNYLMALFLCSKMNRPLEYYEVSLNAPTYYFHAFTWGSKTYRPINLTYTYDGANITLVEQHEGEPKSAGRNSQFLP